MDSGGWLWLGSPQGNLAGEWTGLFQHVDGLELLPYLCTAAGVDDPTPDIYLNMARHSASILDEHAKAAELKSFPRFCATRNKDQHIIIAHGCLCAGARIGMLEARSIPLRRERAGCAALKKDRQDRVSVQAELHGSVEDGCDQLLVIVSLRLRIG